MTGLTAGVWYEFVVHWNAVAGTHKIEPSTVALGDRSRATTTSVWLPDVVRFMAAGTSVDLRIASSGGAAEFQADNAYFRTCDMSTMINGHSFGTDLHLSVEVTSNGEEGCGLFAFCDSLSAPTEMVYALVDSVAGNVDMVEMVSGVSTVKVTTAITYSAGTQLVLVTNDTTGDILCYYGATYIGTFARNAALSGNTYAGLFSATAEPTFDNLVIYNTTSADSQLTKYE